LTYLLSEIIKLVINNKPFTEIRFGIHGRAHASRVLLFSNLLANTLNYNTKLDLTAISISALLHDCGRLSDGSDVYHGTNSAKKAIKFIETHNIVCNKDLIYICIESHCPPPGYNKIERPLEAKIVGDADKLDRFRFLSQKIPCNSELLELEESNLFMDLAARVNGHSWRSFKKGL